MKLVEQLVVLVGHVAWPGALLIALWILRRPIEQLINRVRTAKWGDKEVSFGELLESAVEQAKQVDFEPTPEEPQPQGAVLEDAVAHGTITLGQVLSDQERELTEKHPHLAVIEGWRKVEVAIRAAATRRLGPSYQSLPVSRILRELDSNELHADLVSLIRQLQKLRNIAVHDEQPDITKGSAYEFLGLANSVCARIEREF